MTVKMNGSQYDAYMKYYPDKWAAISALRRETGMGFSEANDVVNKLFGMTDDDERIRDDAEQEKNYQAQQARSGKTNAAAKKVASRAGFAVAAGIWVMIRAVFGITKKYD